MTQWAAGDPVHSLVYVYVLSWNYMMERDKWGLTCRSYQGMGSITCLNTLWTWMYGMALKAVQEDSPLLFPSILGFIVDLLWLGIWGNGPLPQCPISVIIMLWEVQPPSWTFFSDSWASPMAWQWCRWTYQLTSNILLWWSCTRFSRPDL